MVDIGGPADIDGGVVTVNSVEVDPKLPIDSEFCCSAQQGLIGVVVYGRRPGGGSLRRRDFIMVAGSAMAWPLAARAQQPDRVRRISVLSSGPEGDPEVETSFAALLQGLEQLGWSDGRNVRIERRWVGGSRERLNKYVAELVSLAPDIILVSGLSAGPLLQLIHDVPIVFVAR
jgi:hypothetical protein